MTTTDAGELVKRLRVRALASLEEYQVWRSGYEPLWEESAAFIEQQAAREAVLVRALKEIRDKTINYYTRAECDRALSDMG